MNETEENVLAVMATEHDSLDAADCARHAGITMAEAANALRSLARSGYAKEEGQPQGDGTFGGWGIYALTDKGIRTGKAIADQR